MCFALTVRHVYTYIERKKTFHVTFCFSPFQELFCLGVSFVLGATAMISIIFMMWRFTEWVSGCCSRKTRRDALQEKMDRRAALQEKMDRLGQHPSSQMPEFGVSYSRKRYGEQPLDQGVEVGHDDIVLQPSPVGSTILVRRISSAPGEMKRASREVEHTAGEGASLLSGEDLPAPP